MLFEQVKPLLRQGFQARRTAWGKSAQIQFKEGEVFATLTSAFPAKPWQPYWEDFYAEDWEVLGVDSSATLVVKLRAAIRSVKEVSE